MQSSGAIRTIITGSKRSRKAPAPKWRRRAAARTIARSAQKTTSATSTGVDRLHAILEEVDGLIAQGVEYIYFIDEIFLPNKELLEGAWLTGT